MFKQTRKNLTIIYTISFLLLLYSFIIVLYFFISREMDKEQLKELEKFTHGEMNELIEHIAESDEHDYGEAEGHDDRPEHKSDLEYAPERALFYYIFNQNGDLIEGQETIAGFQQKAQQELTQMSMETVTAQTEWEGTHILYQMVPITWNHQVIGTVVVGKDITNQHHFIRNILIIIAILIVIFSLLLAFLSYYLAGKAMVPIQRSYDKQKQFVSDASHELRTPLSIFLGSVELLDREEKHRLSPIGHEVLDDLKTETMHMSKLLENLLLLSRSDQNQQTFKKEPVNLSSLIEKICHRFKTIVPDSIEFISQIEDGITIQADSTRIQQVIYILLENALHYTETGKIQVSLSSSNQKAVIEVNDSGQGIEAKDIPHIFDRFYRADNTRDRSGVGLGLSIAKTIIESHQGSIQVKSIPGVGTTFSITLPYK